MIATFLMFVGAIIGVGTFFIFAMVLAHVQSVDNPQDWRNSLPNDSLDEEFPNKPQEGQEFPYSK